MVTAFRFLALAVLVSNTVGFIAVSPVTGNGGCIRSSTLPLTLKMSAKSEGKAFGRELASAATSAALIAGLVFPLCVSAGNNYPPIDPKDTTRCEVT